MLKYDSEIENTKIALMHSYQMLQKQRNECLEHLSIISRRNPEDEGSILHWRVALASLETDMARINLKVKELIPACADELKDLRHNLLVREHEEKTLEERRKAWQNDADKRNEVDRLNCLKRDIFRLLQSAQEHLRTHPELDSTHDLYVNEIREYQDLLKQVSARIDCVLA